LAGYLIGIVVPIVNALAVAMVVSAANPVASDVNCWDGTSRECQIGWMLFAGLVLTYFIAVFGLGPLGCFFAMRICGQEGAGEVAGWAAALAPLHAVDALIIAEGPVQWGIWMTLVSSLIVLLARFIRSMGEKARRKKSARSVP